MEKCKWAMSLVSRSDELSQVSGILWNVWMRRGAPYDRNTRTYLRLDHTPMTRPLPRPSSVFRVQTDSRVVGDQQALPCSSSAMKSTSRWNVSMLATMITDCTAKLQPVLVKLERSCDYYHGIYVNVDKLIGSSSASSPLQMQNIIDNKIQVPNARLVRSIDYYRFYSSTPGPDGGAHQCHGKAKLLF